MSTINKYAPDQNVRSVEVGVAPVLRSHEHATFNITANCCNTNVFKIIRFFSSTKNIIKSPIKSPVSPIIDPIDLPVSPIIDPIDLTVLPITEPINSPLSFNSSLSFNITPVSLSNLELKEPNKFEYTCYNQSGGSYRQTIERVLNKGIETTLNNVIFEKFTKITIEKEAENKELSNENTILKNKIKNLYKLNVLKMNVYNPKVMEDSFYKKLDDHYKFDPNTKLDLSKLLKTAEELKKHKKTELKHVEGHIFTKHGLSYNNNNTEIVKNIMKKNIRVLRLFKLSDDFIENKIKRIIRDIIANNEQLPTKINMNYYIYKYFYKQHQSPYHDDYMKIKKSILNAFNNLHKNEHKKVKVYNENINKNEITITKNIKMIETFKNLSLKDVQDKELLLEEDAKIFDQTLKEIKNELNLTITNENIMYYFNFIGSNMNIMLQKIIKKIKILEKIDLLLHGKQEAIENINTIDINTPYSINLDIRPSKVGLELVKYARENRKARKIKITLMAGGVKATNYGWSFSSAANVMDKLERELINVFGNNIIIITPDDGRMYKLKGSLRNMPFLHIGDVETQLTNFEETAKAKGISSIFLSSIGDKSNETVYYSNFEANKRNLLILKGDIINSIVIIIDNEIKDLKISNSILNPAIQDDLTPALIRNMRFEQSISDEPIRMDDFFNKWREYINSYIARYKDIRRRGQNLDDLINLTPEEQIKAQEADEKETELSYFEDKAMPEKTLLSGRFSSKKPSKSSSKDKNYNQDDQENLLTTINNQIQNALGVTEKDEIKQTKAPEEIEVKQFEDIDTYELFGTDDEEDEKIFTKPIPTTQLLLNMNENELNETITNIKDNTILNTIENDLNTLNTTSDRNTKRRIMNILNLVMDQQDANDAVKNEDLNDSLYQKATQESINDLNKPVYKEFTPPAPPVAQNITLSILTDPNSIRHSELALRTGFLPTETGQVEHKEHKEQPEQPEQVEHNDIEYGPFETNLDEIVQDLRNLISRFNLDQVNYSFTISYNLSDEQMEINDAIASTASLQLLLDTKFPNKAMVSTNGSTFISSDELARLLLLNTRTGNAISNSINTFSSATEYYTNIVIGKRLIIKISNADVTAYLRGNGYRFINNTKLDLSILGIFNKNEDVISKLGGATECFVNSLNILDEQIEDEKIIASINGITEIENNIDNVKDSQKYLKLKFKTSGVLNANMESIAKKLNVKIIIHTLRKDDRWRSKSYNNDDKLKKYELCLDESHYSPLIKFNNISTAYLKYYDQLTNKDDTNILYLKKNKKFIKCNNLSSYKGHDYRADTRHIISFMKTTPNVRTSIDLKDFKPLSKKEGPLENQLEYESYSFESQPLEYKERTEEHKNIIYMDCEACTDSQGKFIPYLICYIDKDDKEHVFKGENCIKKCFDTIEEDTLIYIHNLKYDLKFIIKELYGGFEAVEKDGNMFSFTVHTKAYKIKFKDSFKLIPVALSKFSEMFGIQTRKEVIPYDYYTDKNSFTDGYTYFNTFTEGMKTENKKQVFKNVNEWNLIKGNMINAIEYSARYCIIDCKVLKQGIEKFKETIHDITGLNIHNYLSISSIGHAYALKKGCYNECHQLAGQTRDLISKCVVGGKVMSSENKKHHIKAAKGDEIQDLDAVSLYPTAMSLENKGPLKGLPKTLSNDQLSMDFLNTVDGYFIKILVTECPIKLKMPTLSYMNEKGVRVWDNVENRVIHVDKFTLEDAIKYQNIKFKIISGVYYNEGRNNTIVNVMKQIFNDRLEAIKQNNESMSAVLKLLMNSIYGKTVQRPVTETIEYVRHKNIDEYVVKNYVKLKTLKIIKKGLYKICKLKQSIDDDFNSPHIGCEVLSKSKSIMHNVTCLAEQIGATVYYQDTDSMHIKNNDITLLASKFKEVYGAELIGKQLGQFKSDFKSDKGKALHAREMIILGKKCYMDLLEVKTESGEIVNDYHFRMKGITPKAIIGHNDGDVLKTYTQLYEGEEINFNLAEFKVLFKYTISDVYKLSNFYRKVSFK